MRRAMALHHTREILEFDRQTASVSTAGALQEHLAHKKLLPSRTLQ